MKELVFDIEGGDFSKAGKASSTIKKVLKKLNIDAKIIKKVVVATYEAEVNVVAHAYKGVMRVLIGADDIQIVIEDEGPGIDDIDVAMKEGYSTASAKVREMGFGAGMGLPNIKKNTDELEVFSEISKGTTVKFRNNLD